MYARATESIYAEHSPLIKPTQFPLAAKQKNCLSLLIILIIKIYRHAVQTAYTHFHVHLYRSVAPRLNSETVLTDQLISSREPTVANSNENEHIK